MQIIFYSLLAGFACGLIGAVYRYVLAYETILSWWFQFGNKYEDKWFFRPVWGCAKCFSGQLAGWYWLLFQVLPVIIRHLGHRAPIFVFTTHCMQAAGALFLGLFCAICAAIATALFLRPHLEK